MSPSSPASHGTGGHEAYTQSMLDAMAGAIPMMAAGDSAAIVEASYLYWPIYDIGDRGLTLDGQNYTTIGLNSRLRFSEFVVTRPRGPRTMWRDTN